MGREDMTLKIWGLRLSLITALLSFPLTGSAQQSAAVGAASTTASSVPQFVNYSGVLTAIDGKPLTGITGVTFLLYQEPQGGAPLWMATQNVHPDKSGHYSVILGSTIGKGLPQDVFASGEARWLGVQVVGQPEQPRVLLVAVPYALKASDADTLGGKPASAFVTASSSSNRIVEPALGGSGKKNYVPLWLSSSKLGNSRLFQNPAGDLGIGTTSPAATLDVSGTSDIRNTLTLFPNGGLPTLSIQGTAFGISNTGLVKFVSGQTFPGTGTITGVTTANGSGLQGGGSNGTLKLSLLTSCKSGQTLAWNGSAWACQTAGGGGTVTSVGLSAPGSDFSVSGSPVTTSGTLGLSWKVAPTSANTANAIVKRDSTGSFNAGDLFTSSLTSAGSLSVGGNSYLGGLIGVGTHSPQALLNLNYGGGANSDTLLVGNNSTKGLQMRDTGGAVDLESLGAPLFVNYATGQSTYLFNLVGIGTSNPQVELNLNQGDNANNDALLIGNNTTKGLQLRDTGGAVDLESIGVPLYVNNLTQQPVYLNPSGGLVQIGPPNANSAALDVVSTDYNNIYAAEFMGSVYVDASLYVNGTKNFRIDHPLDPTNKYLNHAAIESSEVLNQYSGNVVLDGKGEGRVEFPVWFAAINEDFRYQLTAIGAPGPNLYVSEEINDNSFTIAGGKPGMKVSWQVTARRNDAYMKAHPYVVEKDKPEGERGYYTDPELYGAPKEQGFRWAHPSAIEDSAPATVKPSLPRLTATPVRELTTRPAVHK
jgi:hypothetical protein